METRGECGDKTVSIVRIGLAETKNFSEGWEAIFGKKKSAGDESTVKCDYSRPAPELTPAAEAEPQAPPPLPDAGPAPAHA